MVKDDELSAIASELEAELDWLGRVIELRFRAHFPPQEGVSTEPGCSTLEACACPVLGESGSPWARFLRALQPSLVERLSITLALAPHLRPRMLDAFLLKNATLDRRFTEFGGVLIDDALEPTGETLAFLLDGGSVAARLAVARLIDPDHRLAKAGVLRAAAQHADQWPMKAPLRLSAEYLSLLCNGQRPSPRLGAEFPAARIDTALEWSDLVLHPGTLRQLGELQTFISHGHTLMHDWGMAARLRPGYRALFYGPPGTGKTLTAALLGKLTGHQVYRVDLSLVVSKYIGETEKNLSRVFDRAEQRGFILFFDEADALFGRRSETKDAHDRYANQEVSYLLQRIEEFDGIAILASNLRENLDDAFTRRFESVVYFPVPRPEERARLWERGFSPRAQLSRDVDLQLIARQSELTGGSIMNVIRQVSLTAIAEGARPITRADLEQAIRREQSKAGAMA